MILTGLIRLNLSTLAITFALTSPASLFAEEIILDNKNTTHITFKRIKPNNFYFKEDALTIQVNNSASFLLLPFENTKTINKISFQWKKQGVININNGIREETRKGDDAYLRVVLIIEGENTLINPLVPKWVRKVRKILQFPSDKMICIVPGSRHEDGQHWKSPYSDDVEIIAVGSNTKKDGWNFSEHKFENSQTVVGLWIMADGDNTQSTFTSQLKALTLK